MDLMGRFMDWLHVMGFKDIFGWILGTKSWSEDLMPRGWAQAGVTIYGFIVGAAKPHPHEFIISWGNVQFHGPTI